MKRIFSLLAFIGIATIASAQETIRRGLDIIQQGVAIVSADGRIVVRAKDTDDDLRYSEDVSMTPEEILRAAKRTYAPNQGYKGFVTLGFGPSINKSVNCKNSNKIGFSTSHGYQINHYAYVGLGLKYLGWPENNSIGDNQFVTGQGFLLTLDTKLTFNKRTSPFVGFSAGFAAFDNQLPYFSPSAGVRYGITKYMGINIGLSVECKEWRDYSPTYGPYSKPAVDYWHFNLLANIGVDF